MARIAAILDAHPEFREKPEVIPAPRAAEGEQLALDPDQRAQAETVARIAAILDAHPEFREKPEVIPAPRAAEAPAVRQRRSGILQTDLQKAKDQGDPVGIAVQAWRLKRYQDAEGGRIADEAIQELEAQGIRIQDPTGRKYVDGWLEVEVIAREPDPSLKGIDDALQEPYVQRVHTPIVKGADGRVIRPAQVVLSYRLKAKPSTPRAAEGAKPAAVGDRIDVRDPLGNAKPAIVKSVNKDGEVLRVRFEGEAEDTLLGREWGVSDVTSPGYKLGTIQVDGKSPSVGTLEGRQIAELIERKTAHIQASREGAGTSQRGIWAHARDLNALKLEQQRRAEAAPTAEVRRAAQEAGLERELDAVYVHQTENAAWTQIEANARLHLDPVQRGVAYRLLQRASKMEHLQEINARFPDLLESSSRSVVADLIKLREAGVAGVAGFRDPTANLP